MVHLVTVFVEFWMVEEPVYVHSVAQYLIIRCHYLMGGWRLCQGKLNEEM